MLMEKIESGGMIHIYRNIQEIKMGNSHVSVGCCDYDMVFCFLI